MKANYAIAQEQEDNLRLKKAAEFLEHSKQAEGQARRELARAVVQTKLAKEKHDALFIECDKRAGERRKAGLTEYRID